MNLYSFSFTNNNTTQTKVEVVATATHFNVVIKKTNISSTKKNGAAGSIVTINLYKDQMDGYNKFSFQQNEPVFIIKTNLPSSIYDIVSLAHNVSFWLQKFFKLANFFSNGFFLFLLNSIIQNMFKLFFLFLLARILEKTIGTRNWRNVWVSGPETDP